METSCKKQSVGVYEEGHKRETRKSYQKYLEEMKDGQQLICSDYVVKTESEEESGDGEVLQIIRKSRRTPVPKRSFDLIDNYSDSAESKKKEIKSEEEISLGKPNHQSINLNRPTKTPSKSRGQMKQASTSVKQPKVLHASAEEATTDANPSRRSGRIPKPKKSFDLIENEIDYGSSSKKPGEKHEQGTEDLHSNLSIAAQTNAKDKNGKRSRKSQPTKSVSQTEFFHRDDTNKLGDAEMNALQIKQETDCSASPEYPVQTWRNESTPDVNAASCIKQEQVDDNVLVPKIEVPDMQGVVFTVDMPHVGSGHTELSIKREDDCSNCLYCKEQTFLDRTSHGQSHCQHEGVPYSFLGVPSVYHVSPPSTPSYEDHNKGGQLGVPITSQGKDDSSRKSKKTPKITAPLKRDKTASGQFADAVLQLGKDKEDKGQATSSVDGKQKQKQKKSDRTPGEGEKKTPHKKRDRLTLNLKELGEKCQASESGGLYAAEREGKKSNKKTKKDDSNKLGVPSMSRSEKGEKTKARSRDEHASFSSVTERSDGHIILKLSSPAGDAGSKEGKKEGKKDRLKSPKHVSKGGKDKELTSSQREKTKNSEKSKEEVLQRKSGDHIVLKLPIHTVTNEKQEARRELKEKQEVKKTVKRKLESDVKRTASEPEIRVKKKKVFKKKNGQRMLVKIVTEHVNREGRVVKQEEERISKGRSVIPPRETIQGTKSNGEKEEKLEETKAEAKRTPQREKRDPGKTKSNKEKKTQTLTAYILFCRKHRPRLVEENPDMDFSQISKKMAEKWKSTPEEEKEIYRQQLQEHKAKINAQKKTKLKYTGEKVTWEPAGKKEFPVVKYGTAYLQPVDMAAHLHLLGDALLMIATALRRQDQTTVHGALSVLLDSALCSIAPLVFLTSNIPELDVIPAETKASVLDDIAYILPGM